MPSTLKAEQPAAASSNRWIGAIELATNFILKSSLRNPKVLSRSDTPLSLRHMVQHGRRMKHRALLKSLRSRETQRVSMSPPQSQPPMRRNAKVNLPPVALASLSIARWCSEDLPCARTATGLARHSISSSGETGVDLSVFHCLQHEDGAVPRRYQG